MAKDYVAPEMLSPHFSFAEMTFSRLAARKGIPNRPPNPKKVLNLTSLCMDVLEPLRDLVGEPIYVTSGYRSPKLNRLIGGSRHSQHMDGEAADIHCYSLSAEALFWVITSSLIRFDQAILEFNSWVHISYKRDGYNRMQMLQAYKGLFGRTKYRKIGDN